MSVRMGIIGSGGIANHHLGILAAMPDRVALAAYCDPVLERAQNAADQYGGKAYSDAAAMCDAEELDAVGVFIPPVAHGAIETMACERGIHMLIEKPCALDMRTGRAIEQAVRESGVITAIAYKYRWDAHVRKAREMLRSHRIGMVHGWFWCGMPGAPWWRKDAESGGQIVEQTTHIVDMARYLVGDVAEVQAWFRRIGDGYQGPPSDVDDVGTVNLVFESGALGNISNTCMLDNWGSSGLRVMAQGFTLEVNGNRLSWAGTEGSGELENDEDGYAGEDEAFIHAIETGDRSRVYSDYADGLRSLAVSLAARESACQGGSVVQVSDL